MTMKKTVMIFTVLTVQLLTLTQCHLYRSVFGRCALRPDPGPCKAIVTKYYYDSKSKTCWPFFWGGCAGTVPFNTLEECRKRCGCK